jgi:hypothetical protein
LKESQVKAQMKGLMTYLWLQLSSRSFFGGEQLLPKKHRRDVGLNQIGLWAVSGLGQD